jgi:diacylglycerol O-acyltransferase
MQRMNGIDPMFIYSETSTAPMEVSYTCLFDPSTAPGGYTFERVRDLLAERLPTLPPFRRRLMQVPFGLDHPRWVDDPDFDLANHLHRTALPKPSGEAELSDLTTELMGRPLQSEQPPWEMHLVEGLSGGRIGLLAKVHHAVIDGMSGAQLLAQLLDISPEGPAAPEVHTPWLPPALPSGRRLVTEALPRIVTSPIRVIRAAHEIGRTSLRLARHAADSSTAPVSIPVGAPAQFGAQVTARRAVSFAELDLSEVIALKNRMGVSLNDVVLTVCSGALRTYLADHGHENLNSLVAVVPVSVRDESERDSMGNRLSAMFVSLASDREEPLDRLRAIVGSCASAKAQERAVGYGAMASAVSDAFPSILAGPALRLGAKLGAVRRLRPANLVISNVPGPTFPLFFAGMRMVAVYPIGPVVDGVALNITVQSYLDSLFVGLNACPTAVPDVAALACSVADELSQLISASEGGRTKPKTGPVARLAPHGDIPPTHAALPKLETRRPRPTRKRLAARAKSSVSRPSV